jgi:hypothetical protein
MFFYTYDRPDHPDNGMRIASPVDLFDKIGDKAEPGDYQYYVAVSEPKPSLAFVQAQAIGQVNSSCGAYRASIGTDIPFQATVYADKRDEVARFQADPAPKPERYPYIVLEAKATGMTVADKVLEIAAISQQWTVVSAAVEAKRRGAIVAIQKAQSVEEVAGLIPVWP